MKKTTFFFHCYFKNILLIGGLILISITSCRRADQKHHVKIQTVYGDMVVELYNETPKHRDNFIKLVERDYYNDLLFHRIIKEFMIQGGDPDSRGAEEDEKLGNGGPGYTIDAEFNPALFHKKGVIAAARKGDKSNPQKASSGSQFYIVQGKRFTEEELDSLEDEKLMKESQKIFMKKQWILKDSFMYYQQHHLYEKIDSLREKLREEADSIAMTNRFTIPEEHRKVYKQEGGTPHLDGNYTVFGEVTEGLSVIDSIAGVETGVSDRPLKDIVMKIELID
ncbi:peptidylprolyl isomerase [Halosquirtibacter xylanolyticus]|uniref:peptidylprolyl isomerase n=1 Tax=Halosquirtibacter xylanolyticus TaxID=3374599 RepID=UPI003748BF64|nr:peptidylprolyl isomerase [Prolixibacteraceae bacterium]